jgi:putative iron-regulated protein
MRHFGPTAILGAVLAVATPAAFAQPANDAVLGTYADIARAGYEDSLATARSLSAAIDALIAAPTADTLAAAREAWRAARVPYQQTEAFRFGNAIVDDWEGKVNAWPLDEGLIDYVDPSYGTESDENVLYTANVIANPKFALNGATIDASVITRDLIADKLQEAGGIEANVATGYHAVEFLLWGQDLNGTGPGAGGRPATDFDPKACTGGNCERRVAYLQAAVGLLVDDLAWMADQWTEGGEARKALADTGVAAILTGMGSLSYGELAGERIKLGLLLHDPEEEHDCFSDNTHNSHYYDVLGIRNVYLGRYQRVDGSEVAGASVSDLVKAKSPEADATLRQALDRTVDAAEALRRRAAGGEAYDQMIGEGNEDGNKAVDALVAALTAQTRAIEGAVQVLGLGAIQFEGSDSLDDPKKVLE